MVVVPGKGLKRREQDAIGWFVFTFLCLSEIPESQATPACSVCVGEILAGHRDEFFIRLHKNFISSPYTSQHYAAGDVIIDHSRRRPL